VSNPHLGIVLFGDVISSRRAGAGASARLRRLATELDEVGAGDRLAPFGFTQGDELQGLLSADADPFRVVLAAALGETHIRLRWAVVAGPIDSGSGPATERTGPAFVLAREVLTRARTRRDELVAVSGDASTDVLLDDVAPLLAVLLADLSDRQRLVARLLLLDGLRQADVADHLEVTRATVSVLADRGRVREIGRLSRALAALLRDGIARSARPVGVA
jgi:hypothetical protein